jgi:hypothetical protein
MWSSYHENDDFNTEINFKKSISEEINKKVEDVLFSENSDKINHKKHSSIEKLKIFSIQNNDYLTNSSDSSTTQNHSLWKRFKNRVSNIKNNLIYNTLTLNSFLDYYKFKTIRLFDQSYFTNDDLDEFCQEVNHLPYFSYRNHINPILNSKSKDYESDCGWGCMIRAAQMILAKGILSIKIKLFDNHEEILNLQLACETIFLFLDCQFYKDDLQGEDEKKIDDIEEVVTKFKKIKIQEKNPKISSSENLESNLQNKITPPFSIQNICKAAKNIGKEAGEWFSDVNMIYIFSKLNEELKPIKNLEIFYFTEGVIYGDQIRKKLENQKSEENYINNDNYIFSESDLKSGIIFVSLRLGIDKISSSNIESIKEIFEIPNNIGIIGGKSNDAHYFIGNAGDYLLYLDPHFNQKTLTREDIKEKNFSSYFKKQIYQTSIKNISPAFTVGFYFCGKKGLEDLTKEFEKYSNKIDSLFKYKSEHIEITNKNLSEGFEYDGSNSGDDF